MIRHAVFAVLALFALSTFISTAPPAAGPVAEAMRHASRAERQTVKGIYRALGDVTERDAGKVVRTMGAWRQMHSDSLRLAVGGTDLVGKHPGLDVAVESVLKEYIGLDNVALGPEQIRALVTACRSVEQQCE
jgi:hypothetical protein